MSDLISRAEALKEIRKVKFESDMSSDWYQGMEMAQEIIKELPSAEAEWIPCSERLPSERELVLISDNNYVYPAVFHPNGVYDGKTVWSEYYWTDLETGIIQNQPDAWMPLPKPYREESEVEE